MRGRPLRGLVLASLALFPTAARAQAALDSVDRYVRAELTRQRIPGLSVAVLRGDSVLLARGYGFANLEHRVPATDSTRSGATSWWSNWWNGYARFRAYST